MLDTKLPMRHLAVIVNYEYVLNGTIVETISWNGQYFLCLIITPSSSRSFRAGQTLMLFPDELEAIPHG